ncbi:hypothetical protein BGC33_01800 [Bathymodiolus thermophilus thioautotrophic gill symbiont]|uniref:N-acetyltransferase domain-containing protein n=1 Tax=Bathymodiolus thermophilus thioautotrophic gill symbiont TaxID=2360 RepID=A0A1J5U4V4_9GAMM|nr:hypothetical protein BGC33_01650 [Bathymodiolus thermophilus thioautotrophic gill symbiont]OIR23877.1 hypothetical protein BGC33_01800 [Bathymodiolus thermophilus thioautotrophic gill symbiont]
MQRSLYIEKLLLHKGVNRIIAYSTITAKPFYLKMGFKQFKNPIKSGNFNVEFPLRKNIATKFLP